MSETYRNSRNHVANVKRYQQRKEKYYFCFDREKDEVYIKWLNEQDNMTESLRQLIKGKIVQRKRAAKAASERRKYRREHYLCADCGKQDARTLDGYSCCSECAERRRRCEKSYIRR